MFVLIRVLAVLLALSSSSDGGGAMDPNGRPTVASTNGDGVCIDPDGC